MDRKQDVHYFFLDKIKYSSRGSDDHVNIFIDSHNIIFEIGTASSDHHPDFHVSAQFHTNTGCLHS